MIRDVMVVVQTMVFWISLAWVSLIDLKQRTIPNEVLAVALAVRLVCGMALDVGQLPEAVLAGVLAALPPLLVALVPGRKSGAPGLGGGDVKLLFVLGTYLGWWRSMLALCIACVAGLVYCVVRRKRGLQESGRLGAEGFPLAPFLSLGCVIVALH